MFLSNHASRWLLLGLWPCDVQRANGIDANTTVAINDQAGHAQYLYFDSAANGTGFDGAAGQAGESQAPSAAWNSGSADDVEDELSATLTNADVEAAYATAINATKDSINGQNVLSSWSLGIAKVDGASNSSLTKHARARVGLTNDPASNTIFRQGDKLIASDANGAIAKDYRVVISDINSTDQTIIAGTVSGYFEQGATGALA